MTSGESAQVPERDWRDLFQNAPCGYLTTAADGTITEVNDTFLAWTGHRRDALTGHARFFDLLSPGDRIFYETHCLPLLRMQGFVREIAVTLVCPGGRRIPALINVTLEPVGGVSDAEVAIRAAVFLAQDRRSYERELLDARRRAERSEARARVLAETLQASLLPPELPEIPRVEVAAVYRPAGRGDEVGGDFYDVFETARNDWAIVLGDVCGKGAAAATLTSLIRHTARAAGTRAHRPRTLLTAVNEALLREQARILALCMATVVCARLQTGPKVIRLTLGLAGHPFPFLLRHGEPPVPIGRRGTALGVLPDPALHEVTVALAAGDGVMLYTDGVTEARRSGQFFGEPRLQALLATLHGQDATGTSNGVRDAVSQFQGRNANDDLAVVVLQVPKDG